MSDTSGNQWTRLGNDLVRGFTGAFLFGIPLLYTMEMWWIATYLDIWKLFLFLVLIVAVNVHLARLVFPTGKLSLREGLFEAVENIAVALVGAAVVLFILHRIRVTDPINEVMAKLLLLTIPLSMGAAITRRAAVKQAKADPTRPTHMAQPGAWGVVWDQIGITAGGALFLSLPLAASAEIQMLAVGIGRPRELALVLFSLLVTYMIIYRASLSQNWAGGGASPLPTLTDTLLTYLVSMLLALAALYLFDRVELDSPLMHIVSQTIVLGLPATVGGAAGRQLL